jgi:hypothetical protein
LDLAFETKNLREICEIEQTAIDQYGKNVAMILRHRLADLYAATSIYDILVGNPRLINNIDNHKIMVIDLADNYQIRICANHKNNPVLDNGNIDWTKVTRIRILQIERNIC